MEVESLTGHSSMLMPGKQFADTTQWWIGSSMSMHDPNCLQPTSGVVLDTALSELYENELLLEPEASASNCFSRGSLSSGKGSLALLNNRFHTLPSGPSRKYSAAPYHGFRRTLNASRGRFLSF